MSSVFVLFYFLNNILWGCCSYLLNVFLSVDVDLNVFMPSSHLIDVNLQAANVPNLNELFSGKHKF